MYQSRLIYVLTLALRQDDGEIKRGDIFVPSKQGIRFFLSNSNISYLMHDEVPN